MLLILGNTLQLWAITETVDVRWVRYCRCRFDYIYSWLGRAMRTKLSAELEFVSPWQDNLMAITGWRWWSVGIDSSSVCWLG